MKHLAAILTTLVLVAPATAEAKSFGVKTTEGNSCRITTIAEPATYGLEVDGCTMELRRVQAAGRLYVEDFHRIDDRWFGRGPAPYLRTTTTSEPGTRVMLRFSLLLKTRRGDPEAWRKQAGGRNCWVLGRWWREPGDLVKCQVIERTG